MQEDNKKNLFIASLLLLIPAMTIYYGQALSQEASGLRLWDWSNLLWLLPLIPLSAVQSKAGLPDIVNTDYSARKTYQKVFLWGLAFGIADVLVIKTLMHPQPYTSLPPFLQPFPYSIFLYCSGALEIELWYRMIPMTILLFIGRKWIAHKWQHHFFILIAIFTALREPLEQWPNGNWWFIVYAFTTAFAMNFLQAWYYKKAGFLASWILRLGHYCIWHILLGIYVEQFELIR
jgi:hypothetical protein